MTEKEVLKLSIEEFSRLQRYMILSTDKKSDAYKAMYERYIDLKTIREWRKIKGLKAFSKSTIR